MTAYNVAKLTNLYIHHQIEEAVEENYLNKQDAETIKQQKPVDVYMPNFFVKIGLGFLTLLIIMATAGLMILFLNINVSSIFFQLFFGILCYVALEIITSKKISGRVLFTTSL